MGERPLDAPTRRALHLVAAHVLARRRFVVAGRFGLRATPGGIGTPAFGTEPELLRISGLHLVREIGATARHIPLQGSTLRRLASFAGTDIEVEFSCGADTPALADPDAVVVLEPTTVARIARWFSLAWGVMDELSVDGGSGTGFATIQLWPEHFDAATTVEGPRGKVNVGFSAGDDLEPEPYLYVGPWGPERPGDPDFWNAPFGAVLRGGDVVEDDDPAARCRTFIEAAFSNLSSTT